MASLHIWPTFTQENHHFVHVSAIIASPLDLWFLSLTPHLTDWTTCRGDLPRGPLLSMHLGAPNRLRFDPNLSQLGRLGDGRLWNGGERHRSLDRVGLGGGEWTGSMGR